jgi:hypothetical protein
VRNTYKILFGKPESKRIVSSNNIELYLEEIRWMQIGSFANDVEMWLSGVLFKDVLKC